QAAVAFAVAKARMPGAGFSRQLALLCVETDGLACGEAQQDLPCIGRLLDIHAGMQVEEGFGRVGVWRQGIRYCQAMLAQGPLAPVYGPGREQAEVAIVTAGHLSLFKIDVQIPGAGTSGDAEAVPNFGEVG